MAKIIPSNIKPDEFHNSYGEYQIYKALSQLSDDYIVFYSLHWNKKEKNMVSWGESDFTIFHPKRGILVVEVKSGEIYCKNGEWSQVNTRTKERKNMKDPMVQAERSKYTFIDLLEKNINSGREYRVECAVLYTIAEIEDSCFYVFYDKNQLVNKEGSISILSTDRIECRLVLSINCRNTKSIASSSNRILGIKKCKLCDNVQGTKPVFYIISKKEQILSKLNDEIKKYVNDGIPISKIVILTVKTENKSILAGHSKIGNFVITHNLGEKGILFTTARKYKGLEAAVVILIDIEKEIFNNKIHKKVMHVGASRAKYFLSYIAYLSKEEKLVVCENMAGKKINERNCNAFIGEALDVEVREIIY